MSHELAFGVGVLPLDSFYKGLLLQVGYTAHFSDHVAWQVGRAAYSYNVQTSLRSQLQRDFGVLPTAFDEVQWLVGSDIIWSPIYGKTSFLNKSVSHFEIFLLAGGSVLKVGNSAGTTVSDFKPAVNLGLGARLFGSKHVSYRLDITDNVVITKDKISNVPAIQLSAAINFGATE
jgi:outer membrane beta-barrel protein